LRGRIPEAVLYLVGQDRVFRIDLRARIVATVLEAPGVDHIAILNRVRENTPAATKPILDQALAVRARGTVIVLDASGRRETTYRLPAELSERSFIFFQMPDRTALAHLYRDDRRSQMTYQDLIWFTKEGTIVRRIDGALALRTWRMPLDSFALVVSFAIPGPVGPIGTLFAWPSHPDNETSARTYHEAVLNEIPSVTPAVIIALIWTALSIWLYYRHTARYGERRHVPWLVLIGLLGLPGYFGYVLHRRWPVRMPCPSCGALAPQDRSVCFNCSQEFPPPAPNGLEIFA